MKAQRRSATNNNKTNKKRKNKEKEDGEKKKKPNGFQFSKSVCKIATLKSRLLKNTRDFEKEK